MPWSTPHRTPINRRLDSSLYQQTGKIVFITIRAYSSQQPFVSPDLAQMVIETLSEEQDRLGCSVFTYCLMPDHLHFLISSRDEGVSVLLFTDQYKGKTTNRSWKLGWKGKLWQPRSYDHIIRAEEDLSSIDKYNLFNPYRKGLITEDQEWKWSGHLTPFFD